MKTIPKKSEQIKKERELEAVAQSFFPNINLKICMKIENPTKTYDLFSLITKGDNTFSFGAV